MHGTWDISHTLLSGLMVSRAPVTQLITHSTSKWSPAFSLKPQQPIIRLTRRQRRGSGGRSRRRGS